jgi:hypothetical protein
MCSRSRRSRTSGRRGPVVLEDLHPCDPAGEPLGLRLPVRPRDAEQDAQATSDLAHDLAVHDHARRRDALDDASHA